jgi:hypothetical protein
MSPLKTIGQTMQATKPSKVLPRLALLLAFSSSNAGLASEAEHREFEARLHAPFKAGAPATSGRREARTFTLTFDYPMVERAQDVAWRVELLSPAGQLVQRWHGSERLFRQELKVKVRWDGRRGGAPVPAGVYQVRMQAAARDAAGATRAKATPDAVERALAAAADALIEQKWEIAVGRSAAPAMPHFTAMATGTVSGAARARPGARMPAPATRMAAPAIASLPYTVYFANLHSQTNHSDGGGALGRCAGAQAPQSATFGPADAYAYARKRGLDILMASEHNHMYDGSDGTNPEASPARAKALYQAGLAAAAGFSAADPGFLALYGLEWGVINNGGHMNIFNAPELLQWEHNGSGQLIGDTLTAKGDYAGLYSLMRQRGWVGQFNHPAESGQFQVNGVPLGYSADGDQAMALCEVLNTAAFSTNTTESETARSSYEEACNKALESGFHIAFASNQDNHCANWGAAYTNRTGILIPNGTPLTQASFIDALKARRVFATMDKNSQLVLTANGHVMGSRFTNRGPLDLVANYASTAGQVAAAVVIYEGVPGRNGTVSQLATTATTTITPAPGEHFYYARITQGDGKILWSAPVWVTQTGPSPSSAAIHSPKPGSDHGFLEYSGIPW